tara:strand:+ start:973 stop:1461 length:489 start_codon:yes stop_codon:yes gene_type:complete
MGYKKLGLFFCLFFIYNLSHSHAFYVSLCNVYNEESTLYFSIRMFKNDVEDALLIKKDIITNKDEKEKVLDYVSKNFAVKLNNTSRTLVLEKINYEGEDYTETINLKYSINHTNNVDKVEIENRLLFGFFDDQTNIIYFSAFDKEKTLTYNKFFEKNWIEIK